MPIYEYRCPECNCVFEETHSIKDIPSTARCKCGGNATKQINSVGWILKGSGDGWPSQQIKRKNEMTSNNINAGERGRGEWKKRMPKLVYR